MKSDSFSRFACVLLPAAMVISSICADDSSAQRRSGEADDPAIEEVQQADDPADGTDVDATDSPPEPARTWPGHDGDFQGPGRPDALAAAALAYLESQSKWRDRNPIAVCVRGDWQATDRLAGDVIMQWGLPVDVACAPDESSNEVEVHPLLLHAEAKRNPKKSPPFVKITGRGKSYQLARDDVPIAPLTPGHTLARILTAALCITAGLLLAGPHKRYSMPALFKLSEVLSHKAILAFIAVAALLVASWQVIEGLFLDDLLPIVTLMIAAIVINRHVFARRIANDDTTSAELRGTHTTAEKTTHDLPDAERLAEELADETITGEIDDTRIESMRPPAGVPALLAFFTERPIRLAWPCVVLGLIHLAAPRLPLF